MSYVRPCVKIIKLCALDFYHSMSNLVDGKKIAQTILDGLTSRISQLGKQNISTALAVVLVGDDKPSQTYVGKKQQAAKRIGMEFKLVSLPATISTQDLINEIKNLQSDNSLSGMIVQLPLPEALRADTREIVNAIDVAIDVDCLSYTALGKVMMNVSRFVPPTPGAILEILKYHKVDLEGKHVCLVGRGELIGRPLASILTHYPVALSVHGRSTKNLADFTKSADVIITGVGRKDTLTGDMVSQGCVVIDAGVSFVDGKIYGDVEFDKVAAKASLITPVPGGVGPLTVAKLLENTVLSAEAKVNI